MASEATWQTRGSAKDYTEPSAGRPMDQRSVENLLRRLIDRVEESERRYGEALDELHARLDQLSQTTDAARVAGSPEDAETLDRLQTQVSSLARRLEQEPETSLDDFERLGEILSSGAGYVAEPAADHPAVAGGQDATAADSGAVEAHSSPDVGFAGGTYPLPAIQPETTETGGSYFSTSPAEPPAFDTPEFPYTPAYQPPATEPSPTFHSAADEASASVSQEIQFDKRLVELAERLESSIGSVPTLAVEDLSARLDEIGRQLGHALEQGPKRERLDHIDKQLFEMGQQLGRAELQLAKMGGIETQLLKLVERFEVSKIHLDPARLEPLQLTEVTKQAVTEAVREAAQSQVSSAAERIDAMHRDLVQMSDRNRDSDDRLSTTLKAVHESLKQLVQQVERNTPVFPPRPQLPFAARPRAGAGPVPPAQPKGPTPPQGLTPGTPKAPAPTNDESKALSAAAAADKPPRNRLGAAIPDFQDVEMPPPFGRAKRAMLEAEAVDLDAPAGVRARALPGHDLEPDVPDDLVAAARRAALAAAAKAEARSGKKGGRSASLPGSAPAESETPSRRKRSLLMIAAAILLVISALLLYGRLKSKPEVEASPPAAEESTPSPSDSTGIAPPSGTDATPLPPVEETAPAEPPARSGAWELIPNEDPSPDDSAEVGGVDPASDESGQVGETTGFTEIVKSSPSIVPVPKSEVAPPPQPVSLKLEEPASLPPGVVFSTEEPALDPAAKTAPPADTGALLMPPELGPLPLRQAAASGDAKAQYAIAVRYAEGEAQNLNEAVRWFERAAKAGLAPAQYRLAVMCERGQGTSQDADKARSLYAAAAKQGNVKAMHNLAVSLSSRESANVDYAVAAKWYQEAAAYGLADSQFNLGILAENGLGKPKSLATAYQWFALAAANGDKDAAKRRDLVKAQLDAVSLVEAEQALKAFEAKDAIAEANEVAESAEWASAAPATNAALVSRAQSLLNKLGYDVGPPDGVSGERTRDAIKSFERRNGLEETGKITIPLVTKLERLTS